MNEIKLVIFDCDGVLVDSEFISARIIAEIVSEVGIPMTTEQAFKTFVGGSMKNTLDYIKNKLGHAPNIDVEKEYRKRSFEAYRTEMKPVRGVESILKSLKVKKCVGSNGPKSKINLNLELTKLSHYFEENHIFSAYDIEKWKPEPDLYLTAAQHFNIEPKNCLVIEDSINGLKAAHTAGMKSFGINYPLKPLPADIPNSEICKDMSEIENKMRALLII